MYKIFYSWLFYFMLAHFVLLICLFWVNIKYLYQQLKKIDKKIWLILLLIFLFGFYLRNSEYWLGPHTDGYVAQEAAHLWVVHGNFVKSCALGNHENCKLFQQVLAPPGFPFIISLSHLIFGIRSLNASVISAVLSSLTIILVFLISYLVFKKEEIGLYAALIFSLIPINIINSQTGLDRPTGLFFVGLTILFYLLALKNNKFITWLLAIVCLSYSIYVRQESYVLVPLLVFFVFIFKWSEIKSFIVNFKERIRTIFKTDIYAILLALTFFILQIPVLHWLLYNNPYNDYQGGGFYALHYRGLIIQGKALFLQFFNISPIANGFFHYNFIISIIFSLAFIALILSRNKKGILILSLFLAYFLIYSLMCDGITVYETGKLTRDYFRRSLMFCLPYSVIAGYGVYFLNPLKKKKFLSFSLVLFFLLVVFLNPFLRSEYSPVSGLRPLEKNYNFYFPSSFLKDARVTKAGDRTLVSPGKEYWVAIGKIPNGCLVISSQYMIVTNDYFKNNQRKVVDIDLINDKNKNLFLEEFKDSECLVYIKDYRCDLQYSSNNDYSCQFLEEHLADKKMIFWSDDIKVYEVELKE